MVSLPPPAKREGKIVLIKVIIRTKRKAQGVLIKQLRVKREDLEILKPQTTGGPL